MADSNSFLPAWAPRVLSVLRIITAFLIMQHGAQKLFGFPKSPPPPPPPPCACPVEQPPPPAPSSTQKMLMQVGGAIELFGGLLLLLGLFTRPAAFLMSGLMAVAYFGWHAPGSFWPIVNRGELAVIYCFVCFYLFFAGGGPWSLDNMLWGGRRGGRTHYRTR